MQESNQWNKREQTRIKESYQASKLQPCRGTKKASYQIARKLVTTESPKQAKKL